MNSLLSFIILVILLLLIIREIFIFIIYNKVFGTKSQIEEKVKTSDYKPVKKVRFVEDQVITYILTNEERQMKKDAYKRIRLSSEDYINTDILINDNMMNIYDLKRLCKLRGLKYYSNLRKSQLIDLLNTC